ncbi:MAG TPA: ABC transporter permease [Verrucomicrobiae bacterium]|jgi:putative ABC transport system permease protein|nr:ABC transporter permease [Verrucomicrobiae bacterium]
MTFKATLRLALQALVRNKARSMLTMLGIVIGVAAVIVTVAIGVGARASVQSSINSLGSNLIIVQPGSVTTNGARSGFGGASSLTPADGMAIAQIPGVSAVSPSVTVRTQAVAGGNNWQTTVTGVAPTYTYIKSWPLAQGTFFGQSDVNASAKVAVLGQTVVGQLFPTVSNPVGQAILIKGVPFTVIGTLTPLGQSATGQDQDDTILIPYTSAMQRLTGQTTVNQLMVSAATAAQIDAVQASVTTLLEQRHHIVPPAQDDFQVRNLASIAAAASATGAVMEFLLAGVAAVSLIVGGIGIMNIMMVSVTERTREIGLRMSVGARGKTILMQFLTEAIVLSTLGGIIGVVIGLVGTLIVAFVAKWPTSIPLIWIVISVGFSAVVGVFFGYYPARKAARLHPIEALRFE